MKQLANECDQRNHDRRYCKWLLEQIELTYSWKEVLNHEFDENGARGKKNLTKRIFADDSCEAIPCLSKTHGDFIPKMLATLAPKQAHLEVCDSPKEIFLDFRSQNLLARYQRPFYSL